MQLEPFFSLLSEIRTNKIPDLHLTTGLFPYVRGRDGQIKSVESFGILTPDVMREIASYVLPADRRGRWPDEKEMDASFESDGARFRVNAYFESRGPSFAIRLISTEVPTIEAFEVPETIVEMMHREHGLILVAGPTGSGKSTLLASLVEHVNVTKEKHIITIEDPIEYVFQSKKSLIHQREVSVHTNGFAQAIRSSLREDPDIIVVGEMRDPETISAAITLAETGHLVLSTLHTNDTVQSIDRIVDSFPTNQQPQIRVQLAMSLVGIVNQTLLPKKSGSGRVAAREILVNNDAIRSLIIQGMTHQIYSMLEL